MRFLRETVRNHRTHLFSKTAITKPATIKTLQTVLTISSLTLALTCQQNSHTAKSNNHMYSNNSTRNSIFTYPVREEELLRVANHCLKPKKAAGYDDFKPDIVKQVLPFIVTPLTHICNISFTTGVFPDKLKIAKVLPIFKKGESNIYENYRPISILSCFSKILERLMSNRIINFLDANDILCKEQYGFRPGHSTELALQMPLINYTIALIRKHVLEYS
ncbi:putative RNA-directed DNA polymerase from mobile element jockey-like [Apostichopus japonicus]|uniref:Putative RNA-directed DNA polymerase from mobile element jockey-like n=1 Tax=Stichopus japonicus TaxID=307972 RepID=A0A2G8JQP4_STIJA|nr:putative RNA-directed DNA polymerase from mobile element jockey-like [Apostichopus japonicus]